MASQSLNTKGIWEGDWELQREQEGHREKNKKEEREALGNNDPLSINIKGYVTIAAANLHRFNISPFSQKKKKELICVAFCAVISCTEQVWAQNRPKSDKIQPTSAY